MATPLIWLVFLYNNHSKAWLYDNNHLFSSQFSGLIIWVRLKELSWEVLLVFSGLTHIYGPLGQTGSGWSHLGQFISAARGLSSSSRLAWACS